MKKKIVLLMTGLHYGGMERVVFIAKKLLDEDYDVSLVTLYSNDADYNIDYEYIDLKCPPKNGKISKILNVLKRTIAVKTMKKNINPDIVMSFGTCANFCNVASKRNEKVILGIRSYDWLTNYFANYNIDKWTYNKADMVVSVSKVIAEQAEKIFDIDKLKSKVLYNPYNVQEIKSKSEEPINNFKMDNDKKYILSVGRLVNQKGYNHLIKAYSLVAQEIKGTELLIIGHGSKEEELKKLIRDLNLQDNVTLLGGQDNPYKFMKHSSLYVLSSLTEGFPNAMVEAMCVGMPILAVDCKSGPREILTLGDLNKEADSLEMCEYGIITQAVTTSNNYEFDYFEKCDYDLASSIKYLLDNDELLNKYSEKSKERANEFTYEYFKKNLKNILESV